MPDRSRLDALAVLQGRTTRAFVAGHVAGVSFERGHRTPLSCSFADVVMMFILLCPSGSTTPLLLCPADRGLRSLGA